MARSVQHVHNLNFVHLDIKPSNFLINQYHEVKLADFGIALDLAQTHLLQDNDQAGDSVYMAPELLKAELPLSQRIT